MNVLRLRFRDGDQPDLILGPGVHALGRMATGLGPVEDDDAWLLQVSNDRRGIWLTLAETTRGVHVNGRPIQQVAMLRSGDSIHVDGNELQLVGDNDGRARAQAARTPARDPIGNLRFALRGTGGNHHGRAVALDKPRSIGSAADVDLRIEGPGIAPRHAVIEAVGNQVLLRDVAGDVLVNGHRTRDIVLHAGDQIAFDVQHRFVLEGPPPAAAPLATPRASSDAPSSANTPNDRRTRLPWLLLAAVLLAAALSGLLLFGAR